MFKKFMLFFAIFAALGVILNLQKEALANTESTDEEGLCILEDEQAQKDLVNENYAYYEKLMKYVTLENGQYIFNKEVALQSGLSNFDVEAGRNLVLFKNKDLNQGEQFILPTVRYR
ncbi:hypothetical protein [Salinicoccus roseus]|uniref:hypothetical protein n=1 Tax=Salinicoccus roseus TaxID=45670 RepID=UPI003DA192A2